MQPTQQAIVRKAAGLYSQYNILSSLPPGALMQCENGVIDREGVISKRRGLNRYGDVLNSVPSNLFEYDQTLIVQDGTQLKYDSDNAGTWTAWSGNYSVPSSDVRIQSLESNNNFYYTTSNGVYKNDAIDGTPVQSGIPQGLDIKLALDTGGTAWFSVDTQVGYRIVFGREDGNNNLLLGAPSYREVITNPAAGAASEVDIVFTIPYGIAAGDFYEIYRTELSASESTDPGDRHYKIVRNTLDSDDITAGTITYSDQNVIAYVDIPTPLYTNDLQETVAQQNDRPPWCKHLALYKGHTWFGNILREHQIEILFNDYSKLANDDTITLTLGSTTATYTAKASETIASQQFLLSTAESTEAENIRETMKSLVRCINRDPDQSTWEAYYTSAGDVNARPGKVLIKCTALNTAAFTILSVEAGGGPSFDPDITSANTSTNGSAENRVARSKFQKPEAVPYLNTMEIGRANRAILGMATLPHGLLVYKEDGIFLVSGETDSAGGFTFVVDEIDPTIRLIAPASLVALDNAVFGMTTQGVVRSYEGGSSIVSRPIEHDLNPLTQFTSFSTITHAVAYESDRKYLLFTQESSSNSKARIAWVYNYLTNAWTMWRKDVGCGIVCSRDNKLYLGHATDKYVLQERKSYLASNEDYVDETLSFTVTAKSTTTYDSATVTTVTISYDYGNASMVAGWLFEYGNWEGKVVAVTDNGSNSWTLTLNTLVTLPTPSFSASLSLPITMIVEWAPEDLGNAGIVKQFSWFQVYQEENFALTNELGFFADTQDEMQWIDPISVTRVIGWGRVITRREPAHR